MGGTWQSAAYLVVFARFPVERGRKSVINLHVAVRHRRPHLLWKIARSLPEADSYPGLPLNLTRVSGAS